MLSLKGDDWGSGGSLLLVICVDANGADYRSGGAQNQIA